MELLNFVVPPAISEVKKIDPEYYDIHSKMPQFMVFLARKPA